jgi:hypothetical protein
MVDTGPQDARLDAVMRSAPERAPTPDPTLQDARGMRFAAQFREGDAAG